MKTLFTLIMPLLIVITWMGSNHFFASEQYGISAIATLACLSSVTLWIAAISSKKFLKE